MDRFSINWRRVGVFVGIAILSLIVIEFNARLEELNRLTEEANVYRVQATQAVQTQMALQTQVAYATSDEAVEDYARNEKHMIVEGDIPGVPYGTGNGEAVATPTPMPIPSPVPYWQVWWDLFFGEK
jgi:hypothetical protein